ncbi:MAG: hypothetical protein IIZ40_02015 [Bacilli bacterium]|nr:hypothetical protein [Bacilli bacterium]
MKKLIYSQEDVDLIVSIETQQYQKDLEYEHYCNEQLRNKITNLEYKIKRLEEDNKYVEETKMNIDDVLEDVKRIYLRDNGGNNNEKNAKMDN